MSEAQNIWLIDWSLPVKFVFPITRKCKRNREFNLISISTGYINASVKVCIKNFTV